MSQLSLFPENIGVLPLSSIHTSKRGKQEQQGVHAWHPYYAGYAEQFVIDVVQLISEPGDIILDPWNGSGTTTFVAQKLERSSIGIEINPVMTIYSQAKSLELAKIPEKIIAARNNFIEEAILRLQKQRKISPDVKSLVGSNALNPLLSLQEAILAMPPTSYSPSFTQRIVTSNSNINYISSFQSFFISACFRVLRKIGNFSQGSNPTWLKIKNNSFDYSSEEVFLLFSQLVETMLDDILKANEAHSQISEFAAFNGDSRKLPLKNKCIDLIVTSPPYCTRIDYVVSTKPELLLLGFTNARFDKLRRTTIGAPVIVDKTIEIQKYWGVSCNNFLQAVHDHNSKASRSYYLPVYIQYFRDVFLSLKEVSRVLKPKAKAIVVVQSSYFKEVKLLLGDIYVEIAHSLGCSAEIGRREIVKQHMAHINNKSSKYVKNKIYYEDIIIITKI